MATTKLNPRVIAPVILLTALGFGGWYLDSQRAKSRSTLSGFFESQPIQVSSRVAGRVTTIRVREGDNVKGGDVLVTLDAGPAEYDAQSKQAAADQAADQYRDIRAGARPEEIARQQAVVDESIQNLEKLQRGPRPQEVAAAIAAERAARAKLAASLRGPTREEKAEAKDRLDAARAQETLANAEATRYTNLFAKEAVTKQQLDQIVANQRSAVAKRREMDAAYRRLVAGTPREELVADRETYRQVRAQEGLVLAGNRKEDIEAGEARLRQAQATLAELEHGNRPQQIAAALDAAKAAMASAKSVRKNLDEQNVRAPRAGILDRVLIATGDLITAGQPIARIDDPSDIWLRVYVPEAELARIKVGSSAGLSVDGVAHPVDAVVESIADTGEFTPVNLQTPGERGKQVFAVRLRLAHPDPAVKAGMYASVDRLGDIR